MQNSETYAHKSNTQNVYTAPSKTDDPLETVTHPIPNISLYQRTFGFTVATLDGPMVVAVVICGSFAVVQQTVSALFKCQRSVRAQVELVAVLLMSVRLFSYFLWTF